MRPEELSVQLRESDSPVGARPFQESPKHGGTDDLRRRRTIIGLSVVGMVNMVVISLRQIGVLKHLPDPPIRNFDADKVTTSDEAYPWGIPDAPVALAGLAANLPLAVYGGANRAAERPWIPVVATGKSAVEAAVAAWYFYLMPTKKKAWCAYCIVGAAINFTILGLMLPEAKRALVTLAAARGDR